jgi:hypothetical protein
MGHGGEASHRGAGRAAHGAGRAAAGAAGGRLLARGALCDGRVARDRDAELPPAKFHVERQDRAHRRYLAALGELARVQKLLGTVAPAPLVSPGCTCRRDVVLAHHVQLRGSADYHPPELPAGVDPRMHPSYLAYVEETRPPG